MDNISLIDKLNTSVNTHSELITVHQVTLAALIENAEWMLKSLVAINNTVVEQEKRIILLENRIKKLEAGNFLSKFLPW